MTVAEAALAFARRGRMVLPLYTPREDGDCDCSKSNCRRPGKHPRISGGVYSATSDAVVIRRWWEKWPQANLGVATGKKGGIVVLDIDGQEGLESLRGFRLPMTPVMQSGRGWHYVFSYPTQATWSTVIGILPGVDLIADKSYIIAPPSHHASGGLYQTYFSHEIASPPAWLDVLVRGRVRPEQSKHRDHPVRSGPPGDIVRLGRNEVFRIGDRNDQLFRRGCGFARNSGMKNSRLTNWLLAANRNRCTPPLEEFEVKTIAISIEKRLRKEGEWGGGCRA